MHITKLCDVTLIDIKISKITNFQIHYLCGLVPLYAQIKGRNVPRAFNRTSQISGKRWSVTRGHKGPHILVLL